jgi:hypothetical protein
VWILFCACVCQRIRGILRCQSEKGKSEVSEFRTAQSALTASDSAPAWVINNIQIDKTLKFTFLFFILLPYVFPPPHLSRLMYVY